MEPLREETKNPLKRDLHKTLEPIQERFGGGIDMYVEQMKSQQVGLSTNADFKKRKWRAILDAHSAPISVAYRGKRIL